MLTFFPSKKNKNVGVALTPHSPATWLPIPTARSTFTNATRPLPLPCVFWCARSSKSGSIMRHGPHVADVKNTIAARCDFSSECSDDGFVHMWIGPVTVELPEFGAIEGMEVGAESEPEE